MGTVHQSSEEVSVMFAVHFAVAFPGETSLCQEFQVVLSSLFGNKFIGKFQWVL